MGRPFFWAFIHREEDLTIWEAAWEGEMLYTGLILSITTYCKTTWAVASVLHYINAVYSLAGISPRAGWSAWPLLKLPFLSPAAWLK